MDEASHKKNFKPLVLRDLFKDKNPKLASWIPGFIYLWLSRILHISLVNKILYEHGYKKDVAFSKATIEVFNVSLEMFFLPHETFRHQSQHFTITFGKPIPFATFDTRFRPPEWADLLRDHVYELAREPDCEFEY